MPVATPDNNKSKLDRLSFLKAAAVVLAGAALGGMTPKSTTETPEDSEPQKNPNPDSAAIAVESKVLEPKKHLFDDPETEEIANELGITVENFLSFSPDVLNNLSAFVGEDLLPIFPPSVIQWKDLIYQLSDEFGIPPNVVATIMTIESAGYKEAESWVGAQGLFQVMPLHFAQEEQTSDIMKDPLTNGRKGMTYFSSLCLPTAQQRFAEEFPKDHVLVYGRAMVAYNAGHKSVYKAFGDLPDETKFYRDHFVRFAMTAEIAQRLRDRGHSDASIIAKLSSNEINARAYVISEYLERNGKRWDYALCQGMLEIAKQDEPGINMETGEVNPGSEKIHADYETYMQDPMYTQPISPGLRIWLALGGISLFNHSTTNYEAEQWQTMDTKRGGTY